jgi:hypothetical protein
MKKILLIGLLFLCKALLFSQNSFILHLSLEGDNFIGSPMEFNGKYLFPYGQNLNNPGQAKGGLLVVSQNGNLEQKINISEEVYSLSPVLAYALNDNNILLFSFVRPVEDSVLFDVQITVLDENFNVVKVIIYDFNVNVFSYPYIINHSGNNILLSGWGHFEYSNSADVYVLEFDETLTLQHKHWFNYYGVLNFDGCQIPNTNEFIFAFWGGLVLPRAGALVRTNNAFEILRMDTIVTGMNLEYNLKFINDTTFILSGKKDPDNTPPRDDNVWLMILDTNNIMYHSVITGSIDTIDHPAVRNLVVSNNGHILAGFTKNPYFVVGAYPTWFGLSCFDTSLNPLWIKYFGDGANWMLYFIMATSDGGCLLAGSYYDWNTQYNERDLVVVKVDSAGIITSVPDNGLTIAHDAIVYPNPGREMLTIESGPQIAGAVFVLFDMAGKTLLEHKLIHSTETISTTHLPPGLYLWNITFKGKPVENGKWIKE